MLRPYRVVVLGLHHDHVWTHLQDLRISRQAELVGVADPNLPLLSQARSKVSCPTYADYEELLESTEADIAYIFASNRMGALLAMTAAKRGLHVLIEKPMAADLDDADEILRVSEAAGVQLMVNWPFAWSPPLVRALSLIEEGDIGRVWQVRYRAAHAGPKELGCSRYFCDWLFDTRLNGGGALMDYACYGCALARTLMGMPKGVRANKGHYVKTSMEVEDNATVLLDYERGSALAEASWSQQGDLSSYTAFIYGEEGTLIADCLKGTLTRADQEHANGEEVALDTVPASFRHATAHFTTALSTGEPVTPLVSAQVGRDTQAILAAARRASEEPSTPIRAYQPEIS